jgi:leucyl aminopeptidase
LTKAARAIKAKPTLEALTVIQGVESTGPLALVGAGPGELSTNNLRDLAGAAVRKLIDFETITFEIDLSSVNDVLALLEGALLGAYEFNAYKSDPSKKNRVTHINIVTDIEVNQEELNLVESKALAVALVKDLVNTPSSDLTPQMLTEKAITCVADLPVSTRVWDEKDLANDGLGGILGVGAGSINPPRLVKLDYSPANGSRHVAIVGKGITFDTGGLTLKSGGGMVGMKYDMTGAATALAVLEALARNEVNVHVTAWLCLAENMPSATATKPNDVLRIRNGNTVEVLNTDAEGRLVLADGLSMASEEHPDLIIDIATLTGAAKGALGTRTVGAMGNSEHVTDLVTSAARSGEAFWHMPLPQELRALLNSDIADLINGRPGNTTAGMLLAGVFLSEFVGSKEVDDTTVSIPWIHLDIAATADNAGSAYGFTGAGPTGVTVRALIDFLRAGE